MNLKPIADPTLRANTLGAVHAMESRGLHIYGGTVEPAVVAKRRARSKAARQARKAARR